MTSLGATFSHRQAEWLGLHPDETFLEFLQLPLEYVRLGSYWSELEPESGKYVFEPLLKQLRACQKAKKKVVLTVGVKAPRWPEFYFPVWMKPEFTAENNKALLRFIEKLIQKVRPFECITHWQIENEPLDLSGPQNQTIPLELLLKECKLVRSLDSRPHIVSFWGNEFVSRMNWTMIEGATDVLGLDIYYRQFAGSLLGLNIYRGPELRDKELAHELHKIDKPLWLAELQAEPWEKDEKAFRATNPESMSPEILRENFKRASALPVEMILFWGVEYWLWKAQEGDRSYLEILAGSQSLF